VGSATTPGDQFGPADDAMRRRGVVQPGETLDDAMCRSLSALFDVDRTMNGVRDIQFEFRARELIFGRVIALSTAFLANAGRPGGVTASCTVLPLLTLRGELDLADFTSESYAALARAIGTGYDLSHLEFPDVALPRLNAKLDQINEQLILGGIRPVAGMATLRADHPRIQEFLRTKREADFGAWRFTLSVSLAESLFQVAHSGLEWDLTDDHGQTVGCMDGEELLGDIAETAHYCGEPGVVFKDRFDADNATPAWPYVSTAPCAEVGMAYGEGCHFGYVNISALVHDSRFDWDYFAEAVRVMTRILDAGVEITRLNATSLNLSLVGPKRRIGVGLTGVADMFIALRVPYDSAEALSISARLSEMIDFHSKAESIDLARVRGRFPAFINSRYTSPSWVRRKSSRRAFVSEDAWDELYKSIGSVGIRNATTTAMPSAETASALVGSSTSLEPLLSIWDHGNALRPIVREAMSNSWGLQKTEEWEESHRAETEPCSDTCDLTEFPYLKVATQIDFRDHIRVQAAFQRFMDEGISKTINMPRTCAPSDVREAFGLAYSEGLKGVAVFRDGCLDERDTDQ
jgi:ribonucleoside-diphosphate reductase alpha chain